MGKWVLTVAGVAILSVLCDVILPEGQTRKYIKTVFGVVVSLVIIQPLVGLFSNGLSESVFGSESVSAQQQYLDSVANRQNQYSLRTVAQLLEAKGITVKSIEFTSPNALLLELNVAYNAERNAIVQQVVAAYFPKTELITVWSNL